MIRPTHPHSWWSDFSPALTDSADEANTLWGAPRIHGELLKLGIEVSQATVAKYMVWRTGTPSPTWRSFLRNQISGIAAIDMFVAVSASFSAALRHDHIGPRPQEDCPLRCHAASDRGLVVASSDGSVPVGYGFSLLLRGRDDSYGAQFSKRVEAMGLTEASGGVTRHVDR